MSICAPDNDLHNVRETPSNKTINSQLNIHLCIASTANFESITYIVYLEFPYMVVIAEKVLHHWRNSTVHFVRAEPAGLSSPELSSITMKIAGPCFVPQNQDLGFAYLPLICSSRPRPWYGVVCLLVVKMLQAFRNSVLMGAQVNYKTT